LVLLHFGHVSEKIRSQTINIIPKNKAMQNIVPHKNRFFVVSKKTEVINVSTLDEAIHVKKMQTYNTNETLLFLVGKLYHLKTFRNTKPIAIKKEIVTTEIINGWGKLKYIA